MNKNIKIWKLLNIAIILTVLLSTLILFYKVWYDAKLIVMPLIPKYFSIFQNGSKINILCFLIGGIIPAIFLTFMKKYLISILLILLFFVIGYILKDKVFIYEHFYWLAQYL